MQPLNQNLLFYLCIPDLDPPHHKISGYFKLLSREPIPTN